ncbi:DNA-binding protein [Marinobacterium sp. BA1]|uniref:DNA-binding protein n=1 Tax=Marinobacterium sp. BA1 TaxID=3138931 RepID=UPI0032E6857F
MSRTSKIFFKSNVFPACDALMAQGIRPTVGAVRHHTGISNGSNSTLQGLINDWYQDARSHEVAKLNEGLSLESDLPVEIIELTRTFYNSIIERARRSVDEYKSVLASDREWVHSQLREMAEVREQHERSIDRFEERIEKLEGQLRYARDEVTRLEHLSQDRHAEIRVLTEQLTALQHTSQIEIHTLRQRNQQLEETATMAKSNQRMTEQHLNAEVRLIRHTVDDAVKALSEINIPESDEETHAKIERCASLLKRVNTSPDQPA